jgi:6-phosphofructokinase 1
MKRLAIMTSGGDAPGMNAHIRAVVRHALERGIEPYGIYEGYQGLIEGKIQALNYESVSNIVQRGGTILKTSRSEEFLTEAGRIKAANNLREYKIDGLVCCGGDGSYLGLLALSGTGTEPNGSPRGQWADGLVIGTPGTIDNDVKGTDFTIGFDTAVNTAVSAIDKLRDTGDSHNMTFIVEVMGRHSGDIARNVGTATGAQLILTPETANDFNTLTTTLRARGHDIIVVAEGDESGGAFKLAEQINAFQKQNGEPPYSFRVCVLGHVQRGGSPSARDRVLAHDMGELAVEALIAKETLKATASQKNELMLIKL